MSYEFQGQGTRDLYMLANILGSFKEKEIGQIAEQLLTQVKQVHDGGIEMYQLTPQNIFIKDGFKRGTDIII